MASNDLHEHLESYFGKFAQEISERNDTVGEMAGSAPEISFDWDTILSEEDSGTGKHLDSNIQT